MASSGAPLVISLWYVYLEGRIWCATAASARIVAVLEKNPRCAFEVAADAPPYRGVRGRGRATLHRRRGAEILRMLLGRYDIATDSGLGSWLLSRADREMAIAISPSWLGSWDYTERMQHES